MPNRKALDFASDLLSQGGRMLDVGAGFGDALIPFASAGFEVHGIERSAHRAEHVRKLGFACETTPLELLRMSEPFDVVHIHHVLEHVDNPLAALDTAASLLRDDGHVYVAVPNWQHEHPPQAAHFVPHLSLFSRRSLDAALRGAGLVPVRWSINDELQVLARRGGGSAEAPTAAADFQDDVERWLRRGFGAEAGRRTLAWWKSRRDGALYETKEIRVAPRTAIRVGAAATRLPTTATTVGRVRWPWLAQPTLRVVRIDAPSPTVMPITLQHETDSPPIWIK